MGEGAVTSLRAMSIEFEKTEKETANIAAELNSKFEKAVHNILIKEVAAARKLIRNKFHNGDCADETSQLPIQRYRIEVFNAIISNIKNAEESRYFNYVNLYAQFQAFHPSNLIHSKLLEYYAETEKRNLNCS